MNTVPIIVIGYSRCQSFKNAIHLLSENSIDFCVRFVQDHQQLLQMGQALCKNVNVQVVGRPGQTSPQIFKLMPQAIICIGGFEDLERFAEQHNKALKLKEHKKNNNALLF